MAILGVYENFTVPAPDPRRGNRNALPIELGELVNEPTLRPPIERGVRTSQLVGFDTGLEPCMPKIGDPVVRRYLPTFDVFQEIGESNFGELAVDLTKVRKQFHLRLVAIQILEPLRDRGQ